MAPTLPDAVYKRLFKRVWGDKSLKVDLPQTWYQKVPMFYPTVLQDQIM